MKWNPDIFRKNDIRGIYGKDFDLDFVQYLGTAFTTFVSNNTVIKHNIVQKKELLRSPNENKKPNKWIPYIAVGHDSRLSSPKISEVLIKGLSAGHAPVQFLGLVSTPVCFTASHFFSDITASIMVTASHNPADFNGFKFSVQGETLCDERLQELKDIVIQLYKDNSLLVKTKSKSDTHEVPDSNHSININNEKNPVRRIDDTVISFYVQLMKKKFSQLGKMWGDRGSIVIDCGNGAAGPAAQAVFSAIGLDVQYLYAQPDGQFPNHHPDPSLDENLNDLRQKVKSSGAKFGVALDGDGDRLVVVSESGRIFYGDELMAIFISDIWKRNGNIKNIVADVKCAPWFFDFLNNGSSQIIRERDLQSRNKHLSPHLKYSLKTSSALTAERGDSPRSAAKRMFELLSESFKRGDSYGIQGNDISAKNHDTITPLLEGWKSGHSLIRRRTLELGAIFGGEFSGHYFFCDEGYFLDDGVYATLRLLRILCENKIQSIEELLKQILPTDIGVHTNEIRIEVNDITKANKLLNHLKEHYTKCSGAQLCLIDGVRVCFPGKAWGLARLSNTQSVFTFRFGGSSNEELKKIQFNFYRLLELNNS